MNAEGKIQNVKASIEKFIGDNLSSKEDLRINFEGLPFVTDGLDEWVQEDIINSTSTYHRQIDSTNYGQTTSLILNFSIFINKSKTKKTNRHYEIRDIIASYFYIGAQIELYDFSNGDFNTILQYMKVREIITDNKILNDDFYQYNYTVAIDWLQKF